MENSRQMRTEENSQKTLVIRHNRLIESRHKLTLAERRFILWIISQIKREDKDLHTYSINVKEWERFVGIKSDSSTYNEIYKMSDRLTKKNVGLRKEDGKGFAFFPWFYRIEYVAGTGMVEAKIHPDLKPYLLQLKEQYTAIQLEYALLLRSGSSHRIYDLLKQYEKIGNRVIYISDLREMLELGTEYPRYRDFRRYILERAQEEINERTDIYFDFKPVKEGRKIVAILFKITKKKPKITLDNREETDPDTKEIFRKLVKHGIEDGTARTLVADYDLERIKWHIEKYEVRKKSSKPPEGPGWLIDGIRKDYRPQRSIFEKEEEEARAKRAEEKQRKEELQEAADRIKKECNERDREARIAIFEAMTEQDRGRMYESLTKRFSGVPAISERIKKQETENPMVMGLCLDYIRGHHPETQTDYYEYGKQKRAKKAVLDLLKTS
jgi:plasmid replication initiation protein